jgi:hypothetical protein
MFAACLHSKSHSTSGSAAACGGKMPKNHALLLESQGKIDPASHQRFTICCDLGGGFDVLDSGQARRDAQGRPRDVSEDSLG